MYVMPSVGNLVQTLYGDFLLEGPREQRIVWAFHEDKEDTEVSPLAGAVAI